MSWKSWLPVLAAVAVVTGWIALRSSVQAPVVNETPASALAPPRARACRSLAGTPEARLDACLAALPAATLSAAFVDSLDAIDDKPVLATSALVHEGTTVARLTDRPELKSALLGTDEAAAAAAVRGAGFRGIAVSRDLDGALDRDARVLSRLVQHDHLEWFQLQHVGVDTLLYTARGDAARITIRTGDELLAGLRARLAGTPPAPVHWKPDAVRLLGGLRLQGNQLVFRHAVGKDIERVLDELAAEMRRRWEREAEPDGHGPLPERLADVRIEVHVVMERAPVDARDRWSIWDLWEVGVDGMMFRQRSGGGDEKFTYLAGSESVYRSLDNADAFLRYATDQGGWHDTRPWEQDPRTRLDLIRTQHFTESARGGGPAIRLYRGLPEVGMELVTDRNVQEMLISGGEWWLANQFPDGSFEYKYWPEQNRRSDDYNEVRHILGTRDLADAWRYRADDRYLAGAERAMEWLMRYAVMGNDPVDPRLPHPPKDGMLFRYPSFADAAARGEPPNQKLGTVAVGLLGWVEWAKATGRHDRDDAIRRMARFVRSMQEETGKYDAYHVPDGHAYDDEKNDIVPGEAALSLGVVAEYFGEPEWMAGFPAFLDYYEPWFRSRAEKVQPHGRWPHDTYDNVTRLDLVQFGPWSVMASRTYYALTGDERAAKFGLEVADWMIDSYQWTTERAPFPDYVGGYYKLPEELPAMQTFCYSEGTAAAYAIATKYAPDRKAKYQRSTEEAIRFLEVMMFDPDDSTHIARPEKVRGGIRYELDVNKIRIDYVGHGLSTLSQYLDARRADVGPAFGAMDAAERAALPPFIERPTRVHEPRL